MTPLSADSQPGPASGGRAAVEPLDPAIASIQPGGGVCLTLELAWGRWRRWYLKMFRRRYIARMLARRRGETNRCPHAVLDPRDVKFFRNQGGYWWAPADDPFAWRDRLPFARVGLAELILMGGLSLVLTVVAAIFYWPVSAIPALFGLFSVWFFRNPRRTVPAEAGLLVAPADGKVVRVEEIAHDEYLGGPAVVIGIFLSVFNVHINRTPAAVRVIGLTYRRGKFLNALRAAAARENEQLAVRLEERDPPYRRYIVRQIAGLIARRIVCWVAPGDELDRGAQFGMIKLGSGTELVLPREPGLELLVRPGQTVRAGRSVVARYSPAPLPATSANTRH